MNNIDLYGLETTVMIMYGEGDLLGHASVYTDNSNSSPVLFIPADSYDDDMGYSSEQLWGEDADLDAYIDYHENVLGETVNTYEFDTTPEEEQEIAGRIAEHNATVDPGLCSMATSYVIHDIGPFEGVPSGVLFPGDLERWMYMAQVREQKNCENSGQ